MTNPILRNAYIIWDSKHFFSSLTLTAKIFEKLLLFKFAQFLWKIQRFNYIWITIHTENALTLQAYSQNGPQYRIIQISYDIN